MSRLRQLLTDHRKGQTEAEIDEELLEVTAAAATTGKPATLTVSIKVTPEGAGRCFVEIKSDAKVPKITAEAGLFFFQDDFSLARIDPRQATLAGLEGN